MAKKAKKKVTAGKKKSSKKVASRKRSRASPRRTGSPWC
jgi:hypothetical protein